MESRVWSIVRVLFFMLPQGFTKPKLMMDLNLMLKLPGKLAGKAIANLISHQYHCHLGSTAASHDMHLQFSTAREFEFSCSNTPNYSFFSIKRHTPCRFFTCAHAPLTDDDAVAVNNALKVALEMLDNKKRKDVVEASPALPGFVRTPPARQVRVTDSLFPTQGGNNDHVDAAAEEFIKRFYRELRKQG